MNLQELTGKESMIGVEKEIVDVDVFGGPIGSYGFRRGKWTARVNDGSTFTFYCSIPHNIDLGEQRERLIKSAQAVLKRNGTGGLA